MPGTNTTLADWASELDQLLRDAHTAAQGGKTKVITDAQDALADFVTRSPDYADALDQQANLAILDLDLSASAGAVAALKSRREELGRITKTLEGATSELKKDAATLRLERTKAAVDSISSTIAALKDIRNSLKASGDDKALGEAILKAIAEIQSVRSKIETA